MINSIYNTVNKKQSLIDTHTVRPKAETLSNLKSSPMAQPAIGSDYEIKPANVESGTEAAGSGTDWTQMAGNALGAIASAFPRNDEFNNGNYSDQVQVNEDVRESAIRKIQDSIAPMLGPEGMIINGISKMGNAIGESIGGDSGAVVSSVFAPHEAIISTLTDPDIKGSDKVLGTLLPMYGAVKSSKAKKRRKERIMIQRQKAELNKSVAQREDDQRMAEGLRAINAEENILKTQLGLTSNY